MYEKYMKIESNYVMDRITFSKDKPTTYIVQEKYDGSQFRMGMHGWDMWFGSKSVDFTESRLPDKMFSEMVEKGKVMLTNFKKSPFWDNSKDYVFFGEFLNSNHHNTLKYERPPKNNFVLFDVMINGEFTGNMEFVKDTYPNVLDCEPVNIVVQSSKIFTSAECEELIKNTKSSLGGNMEGVVIKNYNAVVEHYGKYYPFFYKYVVDDFKEMNKEHWKSTSSSSGDIMEGVKSMFNEDAIFHKVLFHMKERGEFTGNMKDVPALVKSLLQDYQDEYEEPVIDMIYSRYKNNVERWLTNRMVMKYKQYLLDAIANTDKEEKGE